MKKYLFTTALVFLVALVALPAGQVGSEQGVNVVLQTTGLHVSGGPNAVTLSLRIIGPDGIVVCDVSSDSTALDWSASGMPDGQYTYEVRQGGTPRRVRTEEQAGGAGEPVSPSVINSGGFLLQSGSLLLQGREEAGMLRRMVPRVNRALAVVGDFFVASAHADVVHADDVIITGSECVGFDCLTDGSESFGSDTIKLKENNLRIFFDDTSTTVGLPANDWRILANDSTSGGASYLAIEDVTSAKRPFTIAAGARTNSLYVSSTGRVGLGTATPVLDLHLVRGDTPSVRLDQDTTSGWTAQVWDLAGNESNFFIRDHWCPNV